jgi:exopolyphosphatase/guanosine-5'-triphosphate,3'-diphosphate pyrophosphatase
MRIAALDLGSNSFHLVVVEAAPPATGGALAIQVIERAKEMVRLGESTLMTGVIPTDGFERGLDALERLRRIVDRHEVDAMLVAATSAIREASNGSEFVRQAAEVIGTDVRIVDGHEEARLIYFGARSALNLAGRRVALFDLGGGSLELILADEERSLLSRSLKVGVLRLKDRWLADLAGGAVPQARLAELRADVRRALEPPVAEVRSAGFDFVAFTAGTARSLRELAGAGGPPDTLPATLTLASLVTLESSLAALPIAARAALPGIDPRRLDTLLPGAVVLRTILELCGASEATYCQAALREGMIAAYLAGSWGEAPGESA